MGTKVETNKGKTHSQGNLRAGSVQAPRKRGGTTGCERQSPIPKRDNENPNRQAWFVEQWYRYKSLRTRAQIEERLETTGSPFVASQWLPATVPTQSVGWGYRLPDLKFQNSKNKPLRKHKESLRKHRLPGTLKNDSNLPLRSDCNNVCSLRLPSPPKQLCHGSAFGGAAGADRMANPLIPADPQLANTCFFVESKDDVHPIAVLGRSQVLRV